MKIVIFICSFFKFLLNIALFSARRLDKIMSKVPFTDMQVLNALRFRMHEARKIKASERKIAHFMVQKYSFLNNLVIKRS